MQKTFTLLLVATLFFFVTVKAQNYPYYSAPAVGKPLYLLADGRELPDTNSSAVNHPNFSFKDIREHYPAYPPGKRGLMAEQLDSIFGGILYKRMTNSSFIKCFGEPSARGLNEENDSTWFFKKEMLIVVFKQKDSIAESARSINYYSHITMEFDSTRNEIKYTGPQEQHLNVNKQWNQDHYTFELDLAIQHKGFRKEDSGKGVILFFKNGDQLNFPTQVVTYETVNTDVFGVLHYLSATVILSGEEIKKISNQPVSAIKLANESESIHPGEAEDLRQYSRILDKTR